VNEKGNFNLKNIPLNTQVNIERWMLFCSDREEDTASNLIAKLKEVASGFGIRISDPTIVPVAGNMTEKRLLDSLRHNLRQDQQIIVTLTPRNIPNLYENMKILLTTEKALPSQNILIPTVKKNDLSVFSKIIIQMAAKIDNGP